jgi:hypothetical protein
VRLGRLGSVGYLRDLSDFGLLLGREEVARATGGAGVSEGGRCI